MRTFTAVIERDTETGLYVGYVPGLPGAHTQAATLDELRDNLREVIELVLEEGAVAVETEFVGTQTVVVGLAARGESKLVNVRDRLGDRANSLARLGDRAN